jgi:hypothetical protein
MEDLLNSKCIESSCTKQPNFGMPDDDKATYCADHKKEGMVDVRSPRCNYPGCSTVLCFALQGGESAILCIAPKVDVRNRICVVKKCPFQATNGGRSCCKLHRSAEMTEYIAPRCAEAPCCIPPTFRIPGKARTHCYQHRIEGMTNRSTFDCAISGCQIVPNFANTGDVSGIYCSLHKLTGMINVAIKRCNHEILESSCRDCFTYPWNFCQLCTYVDVRNGTHARCYYQLHPDEQIPRRFMMKENYFHDFFKDNLSDYKLVHGKRVTGGCSTRKPDWYIDCLTHVVIMECDEDAHERSHYSCEEKRMMEIFQDFGNRPTVFVRFNPDYYQGERCFNFDARNTISPNMVVWRARNALVLERIKYHLTHVPVRELTVEKLFYPSEN